MNIKVNEQPKPAQKRKLQTAKIWRQFFAFCAICEAFKS